MDYFLRIGVGCVMFGLLGCAFDSDGVGGDGGASVGGSSSGSNSATGTTEPSTTASSASGTSAMTSSQESSGGGESSQSTTEPSTTAPTTTVDPTGMTTLETTGAADSSGGPQDASGGSSGEVGPDPYAACSAGCLDDSLCLELYDGKEQVSDVCAPPCGDVGDCPSALSGGADLLCPGGLLYCVLVCAENLPCPDGMDCEGTQYGNRCFWPL